MGLGGRNSHAQDDAARSQPRIKARCPGKTHADAGPRGRKHEALWAPETAGRGKIRLLVSDVARAREALKAEKYRFSEEPAVTVLLENRPGTFAEIVEKLAQARINIKNAYVAGEGGNQLVVLSVANADKAEQVLGG